MKQITQNERPIGKGYTGYYCFYSEDIVKETDKAFLVYVYYESIGEKVNRWLPKSKMLAYTHIDQRDIVDNGKDFIKNPNYGKERVQYFISSFFTKDNGTMVRTDIKEDNNQYKPEYHINDIGVKGIDY